MGKLKCWVNCRHDWQYERYSYPHWRICKSCKRIEWCKDSSKCAGEWIPTHRFTYEMFLEAVKD